MKPERLFQNCTIQNGIYKYGQVDTVSYPDKGNEACFQIEDKSFWFRHRNGIILEALKKFGNCGNFLDVGGGNGFVANSIQDAGYPTTLIEPFAEGCRNAHERGVECVVQGLLDKNTFPKSSFDNIGAFDVLEHIENRPDFLASIAAPLKPKGKLFIAVPAVMGLWSQEDIDAGHFLRYSIKSLQKELVENGFTPIYSTYFFSILPAPIFLLKSFPYRLGVTKKTRSVDQDHKDSKSIENLLSFEKNRIRQGKRLGLGSSVLCVAEKSINE